MSPTVFIGSSSEGKPYAEYLQAALDDHCESTVWDQGTFGLSESTLQALVAESRRVDFAVLVLTPDDVLSTRGQELSSARDNVIFEVGLFIGALGPERTIIVHDAGVDLHFPSDLAGITTCKFRGRRTDANLRAAVNPAALRIREVIQRRGSRTQPTASTKSAKPSPPARAQTTVWTRETVLAKLTERVGAEASSIAQRLFEWADGRPGLAENFGRGKQDGSWGTGYWDENRYLWPFVLYTYGRIEMQFKNMSTRPPFDDRARREDLRRRLTSIPGVAIDPDALDRRPAFDLLALKDDDALERFTATLEWAFHAADEAAVPSA